MIISKNFPNPLYCVSISTSSLLILCPKKIYRFPESNNQIILQTMSIMYGKVGLGCWAFGNGYWKNQSVIDSKRTIATALDLGITHFDTAQAYGSGTSEQILGQVIRKKRDTLTIASKSLIPDSNNMQRQVEKSLRRLNTDYIDLFYVHWPRAEGFDMRPAMESLQKCVHRGLIRAIGVSNFSTNQLQEVMEVAPIEAHQYCYSPLWRRESRHVYSFGQNNAITSVGYSILAQGIMSGKFSTPPEDNRKKLLYAMPTIWDATNQLIQEWSLVADDIGCSLTALTVAWVLQSKGVTLPLLGARNSEQLTEQWKGVELQLCQDRIDQLTEATHRVDRSIRQCHTNQFDHKVQS